MTKKINVKKVVLPHSQAKLDLYEKYLEHYLRVLSLAPFCTKINLYDIFCGVGLYEDGNIGSPLIAAKRIKANNAFLRDLDKVLKPVGLIINDNQADKIESVRELLNKENLEICKPLYYNRDADEMLDIVIAQVNSFSNTEKNLVFIDPYGYSNIQKSKLERLLKNKNTEIVLFLPVMQMYRFTTVALNDYERSCYANLRTFIKTFFSPDHIIHNDRIENIFEYINEIKKALSFNGKFYTSSHYIERDAGNYYALFYISPHIYGLDKMVEAKWSADPVTGKGFKQRSPQPSIFDVEFKEIDKRKQIDYLKNQILSQLRIKQKLNNLEIYVLTLQNEFKPSHANTVLRELINGKTIHAVNLDGIPLSRDFGLGISYRDFSTKNIKAIFKF